MLSKAVEKALNQQIHHEFHSAYVYLSMSAFFEAAALGGFAHWMRQQSAEEVEHGMRLFDYVSDRGGRIALRSIDEPPADFGTPLEAARQALEHERTVTGMIHELYELARSEGDYATQVELQWFITEQVEEEKSATNLVDRITMAGDDRAALLMLDRELGSRGDE